uniref:Kinesin-like protein n=1 Tax=Petromyzon marinus TaxID=7757 RepID=A0AAJ7UIB8_PETMA|nr:kinesin-like protein KIF22 [Petromyzon marinus]
MLVPGLSERPLSGFRDFERHFLPATERRTTASTALNARSSRSHSILLLKVVKSEQRAPYRTLLGKLYLIDLAGSEDNRRTGNMGIRLKESGAINGSLLVLSKVVDALNSGSARVPFRDSKLTRLLQDSLGGSAHAVLITNVAPELPHYFNSLNALNFAAKSRSIVNRPFTHSAPQPAAPAAPSKRGPVEEETRRDAERRRDAEPEPPRPQAFLLSPLLQRQHAFETDIEQRMGRLESVILRVQNSAPRTPRGERARALPLIQQMKVQPLKALNLDPESNRGTRKVKRQARVAPLAAHNSVDSHRVKRSKPDEPLAEGDEVAVTPLPDEDELRRRILSKLNDGGIRCLMELQKIGRKRAELLQGWRTVRGPFTRIEDLEKVEGMTAKWVESFIKANLLVQI